MTESDFPQYDRLHELVTNQLEGELSAADQQELGAILRDNDAAQLLYVEMIEDVTSLRWWSTDIHPEMQLETLVALASRPQRTAPYRRWASIAIVAASLLVALAAGWWQFFQRQELPIADRDRSGANETVVESNQKGLRSPSDGIATLTRLRGVRWVGNEKALPEMTRLTVGQVLSFQEGEAEIFFDQAVQLVVRGPASIELRSPMEIYSSHGVISARVGEKGKGFAIQTPTGRITDLGTEFAIDIGEKGSTDVAVFRGAVDLAYGMQDLSVTTRLNQGQGLHLDSKGNLRRLMSINDHRFPSVHGGPRSHLGSSSIFLDVRDNIREGLGAKFYRIVPGGLNEDVPAYVDRRHEWNGVDEKGIPEFLIGADFVMPFNEDKYVKTLEVTLKIGRPAALFVFMADKAQVPEWLSKDFTNTGYKIGLDESGEFTDAGYSLGVGPGDRVETKFSIWKREVPVPKIITLGGVRPIPRSGWGFCMYGIAAIPLDVPQQD